MFYDRTISIIDARFKQFNDWIYRYLVYLYYKNETQKILYSFLCGLIAGLALPPFYIILVLPFCFASLIRMVDFCKTAAESYKIGFAFSFGFGLFTMYWVSFSTLMDFVHFFWAFPIALFGVPFLFAIFNGFLFPIYKFLCHKNNAIKKNVIFVLLWVAFEFLRWFLFQFPWNMMGYGFGLFDSSSQVVSYVGVFGGSFILMLWACSYHLFMLTGDKEDFLSYFRYMLFTTLLVVLAFVLGGARLFFASKTDYHNVKLRLVQGNSDVSFEKKRFEKLDKYLTLSTSRSLFDVDIIVWPEGAFDGFLYNNKSLQDYVLKKLNLTGTQMLFSGSLRTNYDGNKYYNSLVVLTSAGNVGYYDKNYLVPFGEFTPFYDWIKIPALANVMANLSKGSGITTATVLDSVPAFSPLICYEIAFSGSIISHKFDSRPEWILNITNDKWFWYSSGAWQHLAMAKFRAIEEGLPVVRATNSGKTAVFDGYGRKILSTSINEEMIIDVKIPKSIDKRTIFSYLGNWPLLIFVFGALFLIVCDVFYEKNDKKINIYFANIYEKRNKNKSRNKK